MRRRITTRDLENRVVLINWALGLKLVPYEARTDGPGFLTNPNVYHLDRAYGRVGLQQNLDHGSATRQIIDRCSPRECYDQLGAFIQGIHAHRAFGKGGKLP